MWSNRCCINNNQESVDEIQRGSALNLMHRGSKVQLRRSTEDTYLLLRKIPNDSSSLMEKNKSPLSLSHTAYSHSHPPLPDMFAPVILRHYSLAPLCQKENLKAQRSILYKRNQETVQKLQQLLEPSKWERERERVSMNYTCVRRWWCGGGLQICQNKCIKRILAKTHNIICHNSRLPNMQGANYSRSYKA